ncbi:MAG: helix-turn-helix transcriptional regulator [Candidatus Obscuribacterales bacterium]|nr:helix-turn-helix transcriptional regulator [Candidatus Obscuribacterales bacterium]
MNISINKCERQVIRWLFLTNKEIGDQLGYSPRTVEKVISNLMSKFDAQTRTELVIKAMSKGHQVDESVYEPRDRARRGKATLTLLRGGKK